MMPAMECGCEWETAWSPNAVNAYRFTRRCRRHSGSSRRKKIKPARGSRKRTISNTAQELDYARMMGRPWADPEPQDIAYGAPEYPSLPYFANGAVNSAFDAAFAEWRKQYDAWEMTPEAEQYRADSARFYARREQFAYTGRGWNDKDVLAKAQVTA